MPLELSVFEYEAMENIQVKLIVKDHFQELQTWKIFTKLLRIDLFFRLSFYTTYSVL